MNFQKFPYKEISLNRNENPALSSVVEYRNYKHVDKFRGEGDLNVLSEFYVFCGRLPKTEILVTVCLLLLTRCPSFQYTLDIDLGLSWDLFLFVDISVFTTLLTFLMLWEPSNRGN